ncbi:flagellar protein MotY [Halopseudomonas salegens]|uniref:OmpA family protein n=1 Tax=Halopseudomonas salegens TaxID=1434072 RepID=A0A1H2F0P6_9GAMM|nr:OmpA family protein [Halopseudomonas salegens]SDU00956.1 OmpA family protein [Halopseudomonas salegens]
MNRWFSLLICSLALPVQALTFQTRMEDVQWSVDGDQFACRLAQTVSGYGEAVFVRRAGERPVFELNAWSNLLRPGRVHVYNQPPQWRPDARSQALGHAQVADNQPVVRVPQQQAGQMLAGLAQGMQPTILGDSWANATQPLQVVVSNVGYAAAWTEFQDCITGLLPMNFEQASNTTISFAAGGTALSGDAREVLDTVLVYLLADEDISGIQLDGHSDNVGNRLDNRELSRQRVLIVRDYLTERGVNEDLFNLRFHGERYPVASNQSAVGRAANRRVSLKLEK